ncbi:MAG TPA: FKBP-type peptidyl-prolyl cis-trans isomerase [Verrucomicrobiae bacterium]|nr:FKBP-type peptidyl-prolyl cis-trans isomerase [Verrucomicrobiae bacterium]
MKIHYLLAVLGLGLMAGTGQAQDPTKPASPPAEKTDFSKIFKNDAEKISYAIGMNAGNSIKNSLKGVDVDVDVDALAKGIKEAASGGQTLITEEQDREILMTFQGEMRSKQMEKRKELGEKNKKEGEEFLAKNKSEAGVTTLPSGLQYKILTEGKGEMAKATDEVTVNYRGTLIDGTEFDSSYKRGKPATFRVTGVIKGWTEALQLMKTGSKWKLFIPSDQAYGERGSGANIGPNAVLIFEVELVSIQSTQAGLPTITNPTPLTSDIIKVPSAEELKKGAKIETIKPEDIDKFKKQP